MFIKALTKKLGAVCAAVALLAGLGATSVQADMPLAGSSVTNQAFASFLYGGQPVQINSNLVGVRIAEVAALDLQSDRDLNSSAGAPVSFVHTLKNTGNAPIRTAIILSSSAGNAFDLSDLRLVRDVNSNGQVDQGEESVSPSDNFTLGVNETITFLVTGRVPVTVSAGQSTEIQLVANSVPTNGAASVSDSNTDRVFIRNGALLSLAKSVSTQSASAGQTIRYTLEAASNGSSSPAPLNVSVNNSATNLIVVRDEIPANTSYVAIDGPTSGTLLYHRIGDAFHDYTTSPVEPIDAVAFGQNNFAPGTVWRVTLDVKVNDNVGSSVKNTARLFARESADGDALTVNSNQVTVALPTSSPVLNYYTGDDYTRQTRVTGVGRPLYLQGIAASCNQNAAVVERASLRVQSRLTGDSITVSCIETGPNTGVFRVENPIQTTGELSQPDDEVLSIKTDDTLTATLGGCSTVDASAQILIDPLGVVFDSISNLPVAGVRVTLIDAVTNLPAQVLQFDGVTPAPSSVITGVDGAFQFPLVAPGIYRLQIETPGVYTFPSSRQPALLPADRFIDRDGSYGRTFAVNEATGTVTIDVPVDSPQPRGLFIEKVAARDRIEKGETLDYRITISNLTSVVLRELQVTDILPLGFTYQKNTARVGGVAIAEPLQRRGRELDFTINSVAPNAVVVLTYRVHVGAVAPEGKAKNSAVVVADSDIGPQTSNTSVATVNVGSGVFTTRGIVMGRVWIDTNKNGTFEKGELPVPGARVHIEDGTFAQTDKNGQWSLYGLRPITHIAKLDASTIPVGSTLRPLTVNHAKRGDSAFADLKNGELLRVDFTLVDATDSVKNEVQARLKQAGASGDELAARVTANLTAQATLPESTINRGAGATGVLGDGGVTSILGGTPAVTAPVTSGFSKPADESVKEVDSKNSPASLKAATDAQLAAFEAKVAASDGKLAFLNLSDGQVLSGDQSSVQVSFTATAKLELKVNGEVVPQNRVGFQSENAARGVAAYEFVGVKFRAGKNQIVATQFDPFGNERGSVSIEVVVPGRAAKLEVSPVSNGSGKSASTKTSAKTAVTKTVSVKTGNEKIVAEPVFKGLMADGRTKTAFHFDLRDESGVNVGAQTPITLESSAGVWDVRDNNSIEPGVQTTLENGVGTFDLIAPANPGVVKVRALAGVIEWQQTLNFAPYLRPLLAAGLVDIGVAGKVKSASSLPLGAFEDLLPTVGGSGNVRGRAAAFMKGRVQGKYLLTLRYDSSDERVKRLFRDILPDEYYPIYGDASLKGYDAQSSTNLYVRVDSGNSFALYGDFITQNFGAGQSLGRYNRSLTGTQTHYENEKVSASAFYAKESTRQVVQEIRANGTSGPFTIPGGSADIRLGSDKVEIIVRDRDNPGRIIETKILTRFLDYALDGFSNGLLFKAPIASFDFDGNPQFIRVTFERETGGEKSAVYGLSAQFKPAKNVQVGAAYARDENPETDFSLFSTNVAAKVGGFDVLAEWARSSQDGTTESGTGDAYRLELRRETSRFSANLFTGQADIDFRSNEAVLTRGRSETGLRIGYKATPKLSLVAEAVRTEDKTSGEKITGAQIGANYDVSSRLKLGAGFRHSSGDIGAGAPVDGSSDATGRTSFDSVWGRANYSLDSQRPANLFARFEQQLRGGSRSLSIGGDYQIMPRARIYAAHELFDSPLSLYALGDTQRRFDTRFGIETDFIRGGSVYSEYRLGGQSGSRSSNDITDDLDGRSAQAALGIRQTVKINRDLSASASFEKTKELRSGLASSIGDGDGTSATLGLESLSRNDFKWNARLEGRDSEGSKTYLASGGVAVAVSRNLSLLARGAFSRSSNGFSGGVGGGASSARRQTRLQLGGAYRPTNNDKFSALFKYEMRSDNDPQSTGGIGTILSASNRRAQILSADANYRPMQSLQARLHYAFKKSKDDYDGLTTSGTAHYLSGRVTKDLNNRWSVSGLVGRWFGDGRTQSALGLEANYLLSRDTMLSLGYNFAHVDDADLNDDNFGRGFYLKMRFKFDEDMFGNLKVFRTDSDEDSDAKTFVPVVEGAGGASFSGGQSAGLEGVTGGFGEAGG